MEKNVNQNCTHESNICPWLHARILHDFYFEHENGKYMRKIMSTVNFDYILSLGIRHHSGIKFCLPFLCYVCSSIVICLTYAIPYKGNGFRDGSNSINTFYLLLNELCEECEESL